MLEFYLWSSGVRLFLTLFFAVCVLAQTISLILSRYRHPRSAAHVSESLLEAFILLQILCLSLLHGQVYTGFAEEYIPPAGYTPLRIAAFLLVVLAAIFAFIRTRKALVLLPVFTALVTLPTAEEIITIARMKPAAGCAPFYLFFAAASLLAPNTFPIQVLFSFTDVDGWLILIAFAISTVVLCPS